MGRRALRKIDPALDLSPFLKTPDELPRPFCANTLFGRDAPLEVEVGSGKGLFISSAAIANSDHNFLGIEVSHKYARFAAARLARNGLSNAVMIDGDAVPLLREWLPDASVAAVHVYFPDPWWKKRHEKRRVLQEPFLKDEGLEDLLVVGVVLRLEHGLGRISRCRRRLRERGQQELLCSGSSPRVELAWDAVLVAARRSAARRLP
jgi:tRNA (guanine-N7-)-methyltransferase